MEKPAPASAPYTMVPITAVIPGEKLPNDVTVTLNVGGVKHETYVTTLKRFPGTRLADPEVLALHFRPKTEDHFFDRHPLIFAAILNYYRTGLLHVPQDVCAAVVRSELEYWGIDEVDMEDCCWLGYSAQKDTDSLLIKFGIDKKSQLEKVHSAPKPAKTKLGQFRAAVWEGLEDPFSSAPAKVYTIVSILMTLVSIFTFCAATHPAFSMNMTLKDYADLYSVPPKAIAEDWKDTNYQFDYSEFFNYYYYHDDDDDDYGYGYPSGEGESHQNHNDTVNSQEQNIGDTVEPTEQDAQASPQYSDYDYNVPTRKKRSAHEDKIRFHLIQIFKLQGLKKKRTKRSVLNNTRPATNTTGNNTVNFHVNPRFRPPNRGLVITDYVCYAYFTLEFLIRFIFSPNKLLFFATWVTWLDLACILPYYVEVILDYTNKAERYQESPIDALTALRIFRIFRILRIFRFNAGLRVLAYTLRSSMKEMFVMVLFLSTAVLFFGSLIYYADYSSGTFQTLPDAAWWAIVTMTTVGYGDISPVSIIGRIIGSLCAICGVLVIGFTVPVIVNNFMTFYAFVNANRKDAMKPQTVTDSQPNKVHPEAVVNPLHKECDSKN